MNPAPLFDFTLRSLAHFPSGVGGGVAAALLCLFFLCACPSLCSAESKHALSLVAIDVGHTKSKPGAVSARGRAEFAFNQAMARAVRHELDKLGVPSFIINESGKPFSLSARPALARKKNAALFISIHHDSVQPRYVSTWVFKGKKRKYSDVFQGYSLFVSEKNPKPRNSFFLGKSIGEQLRAAGFHPSYHHAEKIKGENRQLLDAFAGVFRFDDLIVLKKAHIPAVLVECGVILHRDEERLLADPERRQGMARAIALGVQQFLNSPSPPQAP